MFLPLTDLLTCPHCGPEHGVILLADRIEDRRVIDGALGCPRCQRQFPIVGGFADLRGDSEVAGAAGAPSAGTRGEAASEEAVRLAALLGLAEGRGGYILIVGPGAVQAPAIAALVEGLEVLVVDPAVAGWEEEHGVSRLAVGTALPLYSGGIQGVALTDRAAELLEEAARVLSPGGRLVLDPAPEDATARLEALGLGIMAREGETLVAIRA